MLKQQFRERLLQQHNNGDMSPLSHVKRLDEQTLVTDIINFVASFPRFARHMFDIHGQVHPLGSHLGRGEVLIYFLFDGVTLGGVSSSIDVFVDEVPAFEIKCATREGERYTHFKLGIDEVQASLQHFYRVLKLFVKAEKHNKLLIPQNFANITKRKIDQLRDAYPVSYRRSEEQYFRDLFAGPIGQKKYLVFDRDTMLPVFFGQFQARHLQIERVSGGLVRLSLIP